MSQNEEPSEPELNDGVEGRGATKGALGVIFLTVFIDLLGFGIVLPLLPLYADIFGTDPSGIVIGMLMACFSIMQFIFAPIWGAISDRIGRRPVIIIGLAGSVVFYTLFGIAAIYESLFGLFVTRIGAGIAGATIPTAQAYIADTTTKENRTRGMALIGIAFGLGFTLGPLFAYFAVPQEIAVEAGAEVSQLGDPGAGPGFVAAGLSAIALLLAIFRLPESHHPSQGKSGNTRKWFDLSAWKTAVGNPAMAYLLLGFFVC
ncbi:MFS transporter, partial [Mariniblastus sp.]|nr:MFS transporter [Mariniblastus sp.]